MDGGHSDAYSFPVYGPALVDCCHDSSAKSVLTEFKWFRISWIGMPFGVLGAMVVAQKQMMQARLFYL